MKDTDKITMTVGQLKKLVKESSDNEEDLMPLYKSLDYFLQLTVDEYEQDFIDLVFKDYCKNLWGEFRDFPNDFSEEEFEIEKDKLLRKFGNEENLRKYIKKYILDFYRRNNKNLFEHHDDSWYL